MASIAVDREAREEQADRKKSPREESRQEEAGVKDLGHAEWAMQWLCPKADQEKWP